MDTAVIQSLREHQYNRKNVYQMIQNDLKETNFGRKGSKAISLINKYRKGDYYQSKNDRIHYIEDINSEDLLIEILIAVMLSEEAQPIQSVATRVAMNLDYPDLLDGVKTAAELIAVVCDADIYDIYPAEDGQSMTVKSNYGLDDTTVHAIEMTRYMPPMVCKPNRVHGRWNVDNSHKTYADSLILGSEHMHQEPLAIDAINLANQTALSLDLDMVQFEETPNKELDTPDKIKQFHKMAADSEEVYKELIECGNKFYLTHKFDFRGRMYSQGYHVNIQSTCYKKALINLAKKEVITK